LNIFKYRICILLIIVILFSVPGYSCNGIGAQMPGTETLVFQDDLSNPNSGWFVYKADETKGGKYENGIYNVWTNTKDTVLVLNPKLRKQFSNFSAEVDVRRTSEDMGALLGIIYRLDDTGHYYRFSISDNQTYLVSLATNGLEQQLNKKDFSSFIKPGNETNTLKLVCKGETQEVYVNGNKLDTITDNTSLTGEIGLGFSNWAPAASYTFTNFKLYKIE
jgi:hypothetical protein